ncbi:unnamed protein product [Vitrella brassicaformis CCMP3155]|uniref:Uncharacterized protein n=1 Tax=Vitrella brassicaformis (strain CCMP3155) TaxID=1169540 RepID=A0A0G4EL69_VITBC|nr:unnamed protein product [Vitrella brassicaformis CCMP3155]|eukprot:CEL98156.1 unnamed protein product [Vitrella brassicaformis CCMP3155]
MWCLDVLVTIIEATAAPPAPTQPPPNTDQPDRQGDAAATQRPSEMRQSASRLETFAFEEVQLSATEEQQLERKRHPLPPRPTEPLTLPSLKAVTGAVREHPVLADRGWRMSSLETVDQEGWDAYSLGRFIRSSRCLRRVGGHLPGEQWATVLDHIPMADEKQQEPLRQLQSVGTIELGGNPHEARAAVDRLQAALTSRGCRCSLSELVVALDFNDIDSSVLPLLQSLASLHSSCCRPDAEIVFEATSIRSLDLSLFYSEDFPINPSRLFKMAIQTAARKADGVRYAISQHDLTHPVDNPIETAIEIAKTLSFDNVTAVRVCNAFSSVPPPGTPSPRPAIINHLQPFPGARSLDIVSAVGGAAGRLLAQKMPRGVGVVWFEPPVSGEDRRGVLEGLGEEREVGRVSVSPFNAVSLTEDPFDGWRSDSFPSIGDISMVLSVPDDLEPSSAAERIRDGMSSIVGGGVRGLRSLTVHVRGNGAVRSAIEQLLCTHTCTEVGSNFITTRHRGSTIEVTARRRS